MASSSRFNRPQPSNVKPIDIDSGNSSADDLSMAPRRHRRRSSRLMGSGLPAPAQRFVGESGSSDPDQEDPSGDSRGVVKEEISSPVPVVLPLTVSGGSLLELAGTPSLIHSGSQSEGPVIGLRRRLTLNIHNTSTLPPTWLNILIINRSDGHFIPKVPMSTRCQGMRMSR